MATIGRNPQLIFIEKVTVVVYIVLILGAIPFADLSISGGVLLGGALGLANFDLFIRIGAKVFSDPKEPRVSYFAFAWIKFVALLVVIFLALRSGWFHPVALVVGLTDFVAGIVLGVVIYAFRRRHDGPGAENGPDPDQGIEKDEA